MNPDIDVQTLADWLANRRPITVLDVRTAEDRKEWRIPGSLHVDAYAALRENNPCALAGFEPPAGAAVVTVCGMGRTSRTAAEQLRARGIEAWSLAGGMKAWSLAWNTAQVPLATTQARVVQVRRTGKGCLSYLIGRGASALVLDPSLPPEIYVRLAAAQGWRIHQVLETHIHADHLSRASALAQITGAQILLPANNRARFPFHPVEGGEVIHLGPARITAIHTPGHTPESACYLLDGEALFTGDTLFLAAVGRPDLHAGEAETRARAMALHRSLERLFALDPGVLVLPGHTSEAAPFDGVPLMARLGAIPERLKDWGLLPHEFAERLLARIPPTPPNYAQITGINESGALPEIDPTDLEAGANRCAVG
jgi:glyoxylase-like metal-dependent hydrolase (beta-lactamase superfamily II)